MLFWTGALPALLVYYLCRRVTDPPHVAQQRECDQHRGPFGAIFGRRLGRTTFLAALLTTGVQGGDYTLATWVPVYLKTERHLTVVNTGSYLALLIVGAFVGYLTDLLGRKWTFALFAALSAGLILGYTHVPTGANTAVLVLGFPLSLCTSAIFSGLGSFLAELYPAAQRGTGLGFTYNVGRALGALFPTLVGFLAGGWGLGGAMAFGAVAYGLAVLALLGLPETRGRPLL